MINGPNQAGFVFFLLAMLAVTFTSGCSSSNKMMTISPSAVALAAGQTAQFQLSDNRKNVLWSVAAVPGGNSAVGTIDANGNYTAPSANASTSVLFGMASADCRTICVPRDAPSKPLSWRTVVGLLT
jgi:outer membrane murein-binding lipoprotein Lpp